MTFPADARDDLASWFIDGELATQWQPVLPAAARRWSWFREAMTLALVRGSTALGAGSTPSPANLAGAFSPWAEVLEREGRFEAVHAHDFARFATGMLLRELLLLQPPRPSQAAAGAMLAPEALRRDPSLVLLLRGCLTLLDGWQRALGAPALDLHPPSMTPRYVASCLENLREDANQAPAFIDALIGVTPNWRLPTLVAERPAMRGAA